MKIKKPKNKKRVKNNLITLRSLNNKKSSLNTLHGRINLKTKYQPTISKSEKEFHKFLTKEMKLKVSTQLQIQYKYYDFLIKETNIIIEYDGDYWHYNPETINESPNKIQKRSMKNDIIKEKLANKYGYKIIRVWESDFLKDRDKVKNDILNKLIK